MDRKDIGNLADIRYLIRLFHVAILNDPLTGPVFTGKIVLNDVDHFNKVCAFWEAALLKAPHYSGNPFARYVPLALTQDQYNKWLSIFETTVDTHFQGETAEEAKDQAHTLSNLLLFRLRLP
ncbi:group III truncated hemoglobin [Mucilaginibacter sp. 14171R-50]|uniref:group III truncated hemoglobin n=1 Tax=Mucilaginibacter sp. 14171R-50 TaxID=2703789 RepID=UPI00138CD149|nr:group III truncated hemoglobin [Mucilaginibacter sp. 14171R-50]QHS55964.1 group III truncated hemoglobin [Mucilaginibacter sp. 14171R-50]